MEKGILFVVSGPSAVGKTVVVNEILKMDDVPVSRVVTCTTRKIRENEIDGFDYHFMSIDDFLSNKKTGNFIESSQVYGNYYGVTFSSIQDTMNRGENSVLVINWEGFTKIKEKIEKNVFGFFIFPPSLRELEKRIRTRGTDSEKVIDDRLQMANEELLHQNEFDFKFENVDISETANNIANKMREIITIYR